jgi:hypothetical protein
MQEPKAPSNSPKQPTSRFISIEEFETMKPEDRQALINYFSSFRDVMSKFFVPFEEELLLTEVLNMKK